MSARYGQSEKDRVRRLAPLGAMEISRQTGIGVNTITKWLGPTRDLRRRVDVEDRFPPEEYLGATVFGGEVHAAYVSATKTLCGGRVGDVPDPDGPVPTCGLCAMTAALYDEIDRSAPPGWRSTWSVSV